MEPGVVLLEVCALLLLLFKHLNQPFLLSFQLVDNGFLLVVGPLASLCVPPGSVTALGGDLPKIRYLEFFIDFYVDGIDEVVSVGVIVGKGLPVVPEMPELVVLVSQAPPQTLDLSKLFFRSFIAILNDLDILTEKKHKMRSETSS